METPDCGEGEEDDQSVEGDVGWCVRPVEGIDVDAVPVFDGFVPLANIVSAIKEGGGMSCNKESKR